MNSVFGRFSHIHFVGIGGIGMSGIAEVLHNMGFTVSGSDISENANVKMLRDMGIKISIGHDEANVEVQMLLYIQVQPVMITLSL